MTTEKQNVAMFELDLVLSDPDTQLSDEARRSLMYLRSRLAALASAQAQQEPLCPCKDRPAGACDEQWGPQCDLGNNPAHVRVAPPVQQAEPVADLLSIARECGLRQFLHGVNATDARALLSAFVKTLDRQRAAPTAPAAEKRELLTDSEILWERYGAPVGREGCAYVCWPSTLCRKCGHVHHGITPADAKDL